MGDTKTATISRPYSEVLRAVRSVFPRQTQATRLAYLDVLRGVAILLVLCRHSPVSVRIHPAIDWLYDIVANIGHVGVDLFFVLSGYLIGGMLMKEVNRSGTIDVKRFWIRRGFKIWPPYLVMVTTYCLAWPLFDKTAHDVVHPFRAVFADCWPNYLHIQNYFPQTSRIAWTWSLAVEEHFYLLLPLVLLWFAKRQNGKGDLLWPVLRVFCFLTVTCLILRGINRILYPEVNSYVHYFPTHLRIDGLFAGVLLACAVRYRSAAIERLRPYGLLIAVTSACTFFGVALFLFSLGTSKNLIMFNLYPFDCTLTTLASLGLVLASYYADTPQHTGPVRTSTVGYFGRPIKYILLYIGYYSYAIYLWHGYFGAPLSKRLLELFGLSPGQPGLLSIIHFLIWLATCVALGVLMSKLIERPALSIRDRLFPDSSAQTAPRSVESFRAIVPKQVPI